jgi:hypothetical protein
VIYKPAEAGFFFSGIFLAVRGDGFGNLDKANRDRKNKHSMYREK